MRKTPFIFCDIDHVLADAAWRDAMISEDHASETEEAFARYHSAAKNDKPIFSMLNMIMALNSRANIVFVTSRPESIREETTRWLERSNLHGCTILMRPDGDRRSSPKLKMDMINWFIGNFRVAGGSVDIDMSVVIDDRLDVLEEAASYGFSTLMLSFNARKNDVKDAIRIYHDTKARAQERAKKAKAEANRAAHRSATE